MSCSEEVRTVVLRLRLLLANDVETNPGPPRDKVDVLEKSVADLRRDLKEMTKLIEHQSMQIQNMSRFQQKVKVEEDTSRTTTLAITGMK